MMHHIHYLDKSAVAYLGEKITQHYNEQPACDEIVVVGVGTNRTPGDALGPTIGSLLAKRYADNRQIRVYGTLEKPVHALNLKKTAAYIAKKHRQAYIIAIDSCLGQYYKIGTIQLVQGPLEPGLSLGKKLPEVGHIHFKGIVNNYGPLNHKVLEHTSLTFVNDMAAVIARILIQSFEQFLPAINRRLAEKPLEQSSKQGS